MHVSLVILCDTGSHLQEKINKRGGVGWVEWVGWGNSSSKAFGISFADRPMAKINCGFKMKKSSIFNLFRKIIFRL
jgi:hypothetical protein